MKKFLAVATMSAILLTAGSVFAADISEPNTETVPVTASVTEAYTVTIPEGIDFGTLIKGTSAEASYTVSATGMLNKGAGITVTPTAGDLKLVDSAETVAYTTGGAISFDDVLAKTGTEKFSISTEAAATIKFAGAYAGTSDFAVAYVNAPIA